MTQKNSSETTPAAENGGGDLFNTAAGWVLFAGVMALGLSILSGKFFHADKPEMPENPGYLIAVAESEDAGPAEMTMAAALNMMPQDELIAKGEKVFAKCMSCHSIDAGGANGVGPNLHGVMGAAFGSKSGFGYSSALTSMGESWGWEQMDAWLKSPKGYISGTSMSFAGLGKIEDRAAVAMYLNANGSSLAVPEYVEEAAAEATEGAEGEAQTDEEGEAAAEQDAAAEIEEAASE
ncbi:c-type cytochrome [Erythrobacter crassostreae]|uniref:C-type cytochrome n=1 Tax=Erythrobacter crassostreae TaxID=2828328 RepID=A0A9X1JJR6_9SPHN|nr:c-type cytochrome [Erythrobacter crassostrea]MBV7258146.1 c-type cytochrome [Erythrobacter crassostrea]